MNEKTMNLINKILYYVIAPILILEFILTDLHIISFTKILCDMLPPLKSLILKWGLLAQWLY